MEEITKMTKKINVYYLLYQNKTLTERFMQYLSKTSSMNVASKKDEGFRQFMALRK